MSSLRDGSTCPCGRSPDPGIMPGGGCYCSVVEVPTESRYTGVDIPQRLRDLMACDCVAELDTVTYEWSNGHETLIVKRHGAGETHYRGVYHPDEGYCVGNPCHYCGMVWHD